MSRLSIAGTFYVFCSIPVPTLLQQEWLQESFREALCLLQLPQVSGTFHVCFVIYINTSK